MQDPITDVREISRIAYGFKASKALLVAIDLEIFSRLSGGARPLADLTAELEIAETRLDTLLTALTSIGLLVRDGKGYTNAPACEEYLVRGKPAYFGDYFNLQTDRFIFPAYAKLGAVISGQGAPDIWRDYATLMRDPETADRFIKGQHAGSMGPATALSKQIDLSSRKRLLDVAGGSGAFTIMLCKRNPGLISTILDFPTALPVARQFIAEAGLADRVELVAGNAITGDWPPDHDTVLMSFLFSAVSEEAVGILLAKAFDTLPPGGALMIHDFIANDDKTGPLDAALWFLTCMFNCPDAVVLTPRLISDAICDAGFIEPEIAEVIPNLTKVFVAHRA
jgi:2-hydroxy-4-(methylsulfanyl)butanoate S-methyltransferase